MCIITTSYPCPEPDIDELLRRLSNTRKVVPCDVVYSTDGRPSSCAGAVQVQHHRLGESEFCSWCSMTARLKYAETRGGQSKKRKVERAMPAEMNVKKFKLGELNEMHAPKGPEGECEIAALINSVHEEALCVEDQARPVGVAKEVAVFKDAARGQNVTEPPEAGTEAATEVSNHTNGEVGVDGHIVEAMRKPQDSVTTADHPGKLRDSVVDIQAQPAAFPKAAKEGIEAFKASIPAPDNSKHAWASVEKTVKIAEPKRDWKAVLTGLNTSNSAESQSSLMTEYEKARSTFEKIHHERLGAVRGCTDLLEQKESLLQQISQHQDEISKLKTTLSQQNAQHLSDTSKQREATKDIDSQKMTMSLEKRDLEAKVGRLMQKIDDLTKAASTANEETNCVKARIRGQQNCVAELEGQIAIRKQVEDGRKKQLEEIQHHNGTLQQQNMGFKEKMTKFAAEMTELKRDIAAMSAENTQLRAVVAGRVLSTPASQGTPRASHSPMTKAEDCKAD